VCICICRAGKAIFADLWNCSSEYGVILTPYGTIAPGAIIGAIAASLQHQNVELKQIISMITPGIVFHNYIKYFLINLNILLRINLENTSDARLYTCVDTLGYNFVSEKSSADRFAESVTNVDHSREVDFIVPRDEMIHDRSMSYLPSLIKLDNVWLATISGSVF